tara:strand:- start:1344 stop:1583 length:240 start_codon:yes stop_codon:yes gene_type:complete
MAYKPYKMRGKPFERNFGVTPPPTKFLGAIAGIAGKVIGGVKKVKGVVDKVKGAVGNVKEKIGSKVKNFTRSIIDTGIS